MVRCRFPYANDPICDQTIASTGGHTYTAFLTGWLVVAIILFIIHVIQFIRMCRIRGWSRKLFFTSYLHQVYTLSLINATSILIRATDPNDYAGRLNFTFYHVMQDLSTWSSYAMIMLCVCSWIKIMRQISGRSTYPVEVGERVTLVLTWCYFFSLTLMFSESNYPYVALAMVLIFCMIYAATLAIVAWGNGYQVYRHLINYERAAASRENKTSTGIPSTAGSGPSSPVTPKKSIKTNSVQKKKSTVTVILKLLVILTVCLIVAIMAQCYYAVMAIVNKYDHINNPDPYPQWTFASLVTASAFMIVQTLCTIVCLLFFRKFGNESTDHSSLNPSQTDPSQHTKQNKEPKDSRGVTRAPTPRKGTIDLSSHHIPLHDINIQGSSAQLLSHDLTRASVETAVIDIPTPTSPSITSIPRPTTLPPHPHPAAFRAMSAEGRTLATQAQNDRISQSIAATTNRDSNSHSHPFQPGTRGTQGIGLSGVIIDIDGNKSSPSHSRSHSGETTRKSPATNHI